MANITVINPFEVSEGQVEQAVLLWDQLAEFFRSQPGHVSSRLLRALTPDARFQLITHAEWESVEHFVSALSQPQLHEILESAGDHPANYPGMYEIIRS